MANIIPSLASANPLCLQSQIDELDGYPYLHLDVEDGNFVPNITFGMKTIRAVAAYSDKMLDAHLMVMRPEEYVADLVDAGVQKIAFHIEKVSYPAVVLNHIKERGAKAGLALNCMRQIDQILPYVDLVDYLLVMTSEPDGRGQLFNSCMLDKISEARRVLPERISIMADGGISESNMGLVKEAGADEIVMGRAVWNAEDAGIQIRELMKKLNGKEMKNAE